MTFIEIALHAAFPGLQFEARRLSKEGIEGVMLLPEATPLEAVFGWLQREETV